MSRRRVGETYRYTELIRHAGAIMPRRKKRKKKRRGGIRRREKKRNGEKEKGGEGKLVVDEIPQIILFKERGRDRTLRNEYKCKNQPARPFGARDEIRKGALEAVLSLPPLSFSFSLFLSLPLPLSFFSTSFALAARGWLGNVEVGV